MNQSGNSAEPPASVPRESRDRVPRGVRQLQYRMDGEPGKGRAPGPRAVAPGGRAGHVTRAGSRSAGDPGHVGGEDLAAACPQQVPRPGLRLDTGQHPAVAVRHHDARMPPGARVWLAGFSTSEVPASVQAACLYDASREPAAQCVTFSVGCVLFQVFATGQTDADLSPDNEAWLAPKGPYTSALLQIAPSCSPLRWPPGVVFGVGDREALAGPLGRGLPPRPSEEDFPGPSPSRSA